MIGFPDGLQAYIYIYHLGLKFDLPVLPENVSDNTSVNFTSTQILGRSAPQQTYSGSGPRQLMLDLKFHRQMFTIENPEISKILAHRLSHEYGKFTDERRKGLVAVKDPVTGETILSKAEDALDYMINAIQALAYPKYLDGVKAIIPPSLLVRLGNEYAIRGVPVQVSKSSSGPWLKNGKQAEVHLSLQIQETTPYSAQYVATNGGLREISTTLERSSVWQWS